MTPAEPARTKPFAAPVLAAAAACFIVLLWASPPWADDWDGLGFLASIGRFDLDAFAPHPPGYPVYVALLKVASAALGSSAKAPFAAAVVAALSGGCTVALFGSAFQEAFGASSLESACVGVATVIAPLGFRCLSGVGSEAPAIAFASLALFGLARRSRLAVGLGVGLGLGVRLSWAPLFLPMLLLAPRGHRLWTWAITFAATMAWAIPLAAVVGLPHLVHLYQVHLAGHATRWGGTAITEPARAPWLARDIFVDGLGIELDPLGVAIGIATVVTLSLGLHAFRQRGSLRNEGPCRHWARVTAWVMGPYLIWITLGQNLREQPRHTLPIVAALAMGLAAIGRLDRFARLASGGLFVLMAARTGSDARDRRRDPPPGAALATYVGSQVGSSQSEGANATSVLVFGTQSIRFLEGTAWADSARGAESMGDVLMALTHARRFPSRLFVTSEISSPDLHEDAARKRVATFCRPPRLDRKEPCLDLFELDPKKLPIP